MTMLVYYRTTELYVRLAIFSAFRMFGANFIKLLFQKQQLSGTNGIFGQTEQPQYMATLRLFGVVQRILIL
jgi:hypothetical protein